MAGLLRLAVCRDKLWSRTAHAAMSAQGRRSLRAKKHQLSLPRGALFVYDETTRDLVDVFFDDLVGPLPPELEAKPALPRPPDSMTGRQHPNDWKATDFAQRW